MSEDEQATVRVRKDKGRRSGVRDREFNVSGNAGYYRGDGEVKDEFRRRGHSYYLLIS